jgi:sterol desaturase/sphingolipid hydroxylase (fatty acid hydroxylase superfamily)
MAGMSPSQIIVLATPVFLALIALEFAVGWRRRHNTYRFSDAISSIGLGMLSQVGAVFTPLLRLGLYTLVYQHLAPWPGAGFWTTPAGWLLALVFYDFLYYWNHRLGHTVAVFWAAHVVHHQSQDYNLSTALRQPGTYPLLGWVFYLPMALAGVPPLVFVVVGLVDLLYQFWIHTEQIGRLGRFDRWLASPSNHRVHHAVNDRYLDKNYGGILMLWDHLFGTFEPEDPQEPCVYGTRSPLNSWDPLWANAEVYAALARDSCRAQRWADKLRVWFKPPGWRPADVAARWPQPAFDMARVQTFSPPVGRPVTVFAAGLFALLLGGVAAFLWQADTAPLAHNAAGFAVLLAGVWALGALLQGRLATDEVLFVLCGALAMATAVFGWTEAHRVFKPLAMLLALARVLRVPATPGRGWLLAALVGSLAGDVFLMFEGFFIPGRVAFLLAHLAYIARLPHLQRHQLQHAGLQTAQIVQPLRAHAGRHTRQRLAQRAVGRHVALLQRLDQLPLAQAPRLLRLGIRLQGLFGLLEGGQHLAQRRLFGEQGAVIHPGWRGPDQTRHGHRGQRRGLPLAATAQGRTGLLVHQFHQQPGHGRTGQQAAHMGRVVDTVAREALGQRREHEQALRGQQLVDHRLGHPFAVLPRARQHRAQHAEHRARGSDRHRLLG